MNYINNAGVSAPKILPEISKLKNFSWFGRDICLLVSELTPATKIAAASLVLFSTAFILGQYLRRDNDNNKNKTGQNDLKIEQDPIKINTNPESSEKSGISSVEKSNDKIKLDQNGFEKLFTLKIEEILFGNSDHFENNMNLAFKDHHEQFNEFPDVLIRLIKRNPDNLQFMGIECLKSVFASDTFIMSFVNGDIEMKDKDLKNLFLKYIEYIENKESSLSNTESFVKGFKDDLMNEETVSSSVKKLKFELLCSITENLCDRS